MNRLAGTTFARACDRDHARVGARARARARGFTILEIVITAVIAAIIAASAINMLSGGRYERVQAGIRLLQSDMDVARATALSSPGDPVVLRLHADGTGYHVARASAPDTPLTGANGPITITFGVGRGEAAAGCSISTVSGVLTLQFGPFGGIEDPVPTVQVTLLDGSERATVLLDPLTGDPTVMYENQ